MFGNAYKNIASLKLIHKHTNQLSCGKFLTLVFELQRT